MQKIKKFVSVLTVVLVLLYSAGCAYISPGIENEPIGCISVTATVMIEETMYNALVNSTIGTECDVLESTNNTLTDVDSTNGDSSLLKEFMRENEQINGRNYYSYTTTQEEYAPYNLIIKKLNSLEVMRGFPLFSTITITNDKNESLNFFIKATEIPVDILKTELQIDVVPEDWLQLVFKISMDGTIDEIENSEGITLVSRKSNEVCYEINNFSKAQTLSVHSSLNAPSAVPLAIVGTVICSIIVVLLCVIARKNDDQEKN